jgi:hypothetical protein
MHRVSQRKKIIKATNVAAITMMDDLDSDHNSELEDIYFFSMSQLQKQYLAAQNFTTQFDPRYDTSELQGLADMMFPCFLNLVQLIKQNSIFYNNSRNPQKDPPIESL